MLSVRERARDGVSDPPPPPSLSEPNRGVKPAGSTPPVLGAAPNLTTTDCSPTPKTPMDRCTLLRATLERSVPTAHDMLTIVTYPAGRHHTSSRMHGEFLRLLFLQAHRQTAAHFITIGIQ